MFHPFNTNKEDFSFFSSFSPITMDYKYIEDEYPSGNRMIITCTILQSLMPMIDDDTHSFGGDSGFSVGKEDYYDADSVSSFNEKPSTSFFSRVASIPIIKDSLSSAHQYVQQNSVGKKALYFAETKLPTELFTQNSMINAIGNKSLDMIERQFPMIVRPTDEIVSELQTQKSNMIKPSIDFITEHLESMMDQYLPELSEEKKEEEEGVDRLWNTMNHLSLRTTKMISEKMSATVEEEKQLKKMVQEWMIEQVTMITTKQRSLVIQNAYEFAQIELEKVRQELFNTDKSHMDRMRNILILSQKDIWMPLYQKAFSLFGQRATPVHHH